VSLGGREGEGRGGREGGYLDVVLQGVDDLLRLQVAVDVDVAAVLVLGTG
jgi:hypothetical protein